MYRFFVEENQIRDEKVHIQGEDVNHIKNVLRMHPGEKILVSAGGTEEYHCTVEAYADGEVIAAVDEVTAAQKELPSRICLFQGLPKSDKMELIVQKAVELGAAQIVPVEMERCVVKLDAKKAANRVERWQAIAQSAAKQSKRMIIPKVHPVVTYQEALAMAEEMEVGLIPYEHAQGMEHTREVLEAIRPGASIGIFIGPEGGISEEEIRQAMERCVEPVTLGGRILRTETAGMTVLAVLMYLLEGKTGQERKE
ncbi:MAG: 16S rRNA (uracil(1498)-N(3))-methyltransferase [Fusicatenibacter sp.]|nr:16S rRNA (uracil(1498)-N(3))-methyltransferase [Lachnospiraceae bacterium]MDY2938061.1 16S rRNA (uracil(1498)-N(3))-methyltransferase [Fusicatenibacter sp.]